MFTTSIQKRILGLERENDLIDGQMRDNQDFTHYDYWLENEKEIADAYTVLCTIKRKGLK